MTPERYAAALPLPEYIETARKNLDFWRGVSRTARLPQDIAESAACVPGTWRLLALSEDWCGDAVNTLPLVARLAEAIPGAELRILGRDTNPDLMNDHLTRGTRSIPVVMVYDASFVERGWWGPRPSGLQTLFETELRSLEKDERTLRVRTWYARDRGRSTAAEVLALIVAAAGGQRPSTAGPPAG
jgi:hypothetical protein